MTAPWRERPAPATGNGCQPSRAEALARQIARESFEKALTGHQLAGVLFIAAARTQGAGREAMLSEALRLMRAIRG